MNADDGGPAAPAASAATIGEAHIARLRHTLATYAGRLQRRVQASRTEFANCTASVLDHLCTTVPATNPRKVGLFLYLGRERSPLEWVRFPSSLNSALLRFANARRITLPARHAPVPRDPRYRVSRAKELYPQSPPIYDWGWRYEDFRRRGVNAQPWEAALAADFENAVAGPLRRALRAVHLADSYLGQLRPIEAIEWDLDAAAAMVSEKVHVPLPGAGSLSERWQPSRVAPRPLAMPEGDPLLWQALLLRLLTAVEIRLRACATEYAASATLLRDWLDPDRQYLWQGPVLAPRVLVPPGGFADPIIVWQAAKPGHHPDPADPRTEGSKELSWNSSEHRARYRSYAAACSARREHPCTLHEFYWVTEAPRLLKDFAPAQPWERWFALHYDRSVITLLRRQWLLISRCLHLQRALVDPDDCQLRLDRDKYLPHAL